VVLNNFKRTSLPKKTTLEKIKKVQASQKIIETESKENQRISSILTLLDLVFQL
jgi:hypothetical protein